MTAAVQPPYPPAGNAWEEQIVPTLRKRLEQESRILENRLSVHSLTSNSRDEHYQQPTSSFASPSAQPRQQQPLSQSDSRSPTPSSKGQGNRNYSDTYRPTAIPRPSSSMAKDSPYSADRPHTAATIVPSPGPSNMRRDGSGSNISGSGSNKPPFTRSRTRSTPYPFENDDGASAPAPNGRRTPNAGVNYGGRHASGTADPTALNGIPTPASSRANSPMVMNGKQPSQPPPSKIPQRKRARSTSNSDTPMKASVGRAGGSKIAKRSAASGQEQITFPPSPETSPDIWRDQPNDVEPSRNLHPGDKIRDEAPPFNPNRLSAAPSVEEREFEHWYRGEGRDGGGRNGGRGEIKVAKAHTQKEMLDIAVGGYDLGGDDRWMTSRQRQQAALDSVTMRRRADQMDYVPHERELSDMENDYSEDPHDQATAEDPYEYYYMTQEDTRPEPETSRIPAPPLPRAAPSSTIPVAQAQPRASLDSRAQSPTSSASHATHKQVQKAKGHTATSSESSRKTGRPSAAKIPSTPRKSQPRPRAPSRPSNVGGERAPITADAIPPWGQSPRPPTGGNWDDMVLPVVAKKMGLNNESQPDITMLGTDTVKQKEREKNQVYEPAAGLFGYDPAKRRDDAPKRKDKTGPSMEFGDVLSLPPAKPASPPVSPDFPPRQDSPPPFSSYAIGIHDKEPEPEPEVASAAPSQHSQQSSELRVPRPPPVSLSKEELKQRGKELRKSRPAIVVTSPSEMATPVGRPGKEEEEEGAGCCKCVIM